MKCNRYLSYFYELPEEYRLQTGDCKVFWSEFCEYFEELTNGDIDTKELFKLFKYTELPRSIFCVIDDKELCNKVAIMFFNFITQKPIYHHDLYIAVCEGFILVLKFNVLSDLEFEWKPLYERFLYILKHPFAMIGDTSEMIKSIQSIAIHLGRYFPSDDLDEVMETILPENSPKGNNSALQMETLFCFIPIKNGEGIKKWLPTFQYILENITSHRIIPSILITMNRILRLNQSLDLSCLIPGTKALITTIILNGGIPGHFTLEVQRTKFEPRIDYPSAIGQFIGWLIIAPCTRVEMTEFLLSAIKTVNELIRDEIVDETTIECFLNGIVNTIYHYQTRKITSEFKLTEEELIHLFNPIFEVQIGMARQSSISAFLRSFKVEMYLVNSLVRRSFEFAKQCIQCADIGHVSKFGWGLLTDIISFLPNEQFLKDALPDIIDAALANSYMDEIQTEIITIITTIITIVPFNRNNTLPGLENLDFPGIASRILRSYFDNLKKIPSIKGKPAMVKDEAADFMTLVVYNLINSGEDEVIEAVASIITETILDPDYGHVFSAFYSLLECLSQTNLKYLENIRDRALALIPNTGDPRILSNRIVMYCSVEKNHATTIEEIRKAIEIVRPYTNHSVRFVKKSAWMGIALLVSYSNSRNRMKIQRKDGNPGQIMANPSDFCIIPTNCVDTYDLAKEVFLPEINKIMTIEDPNELLAHIREIRGGIKSMVTTFPYWSEEESSDYSPLSHFSFYKPLPHTIRANEIRDRVLEVTTFVMNKFPDNPTLLAKTYAMTISCFDTIIWSTDRVSMSKSTKILINNFTSEINSFKMTNLSLFLLITFLFKQYREYIHQFPYTPVTNKFFETVTRLGTSQYTMIRSIMYDYARRVGDFFIPQNINVIKDIMKNIDTIQNDELIDFISFAKTREVLRNYPEIFYGIILHILNNFQLKDQDSLLKLKITLTAEVVKYFDCEGGNPFYEKIMQQVDEMIKRPGIKHRTYTQCALFIMLECLQKKVMLSDTLHEFMLEMCVHNDPDISKLGRFCFQMNTKLAMVRETTDIDFTETRKLGDFEDMIGSCKLDYDPSMFSDPSANISVEVVPDESLDGSLADQVEEEDEEEEDLSGSFNMDDLDPKMKMIFDAMEGSEEMSPEIAKMIDNLSANEMNTILSGGGKSNVSKGIISHIYDALDKMNIEYPETYKHYFYKEQAAGWYAFPKKVTKINYRFEKDINLSDEKIAELVKRSILLTDADNEVDESAYLFYSTISFYLTKNTIDEMAKAVREVLMGPIRESNVHAMEDLISSTISRAYQMDASIVRYFFEKIALPIFLVTSQNPSFIDEVMAPSIMSYIAGAPLTFFTPLIRLSYDIIRNNPYNPGSVERSMFTILGLMPYCTPHWFFPSIDILLDTLIKPFFDNITKYPRSISEDYTSLFLQLCESTAIPPFSPLYDQRIVEKQAKLAQFLDEALSKLNPNCKEHQSALLSFISNLICASLECAKFIMPIALKHLSLFFDTLNASDAMTQESMSESLYDIVLHPFFSFESSYLLEYWDHVFKVMGRMSAPVQEDIVGQIEQHIFCYGCILTHDQLLSVTKMTHDFVSTCRNENVVIMALPIIGRAFEATGDCFDTLDDFTAMGIVSQLSLFDTVDDKHIRVLRYLADRIEATNGTLMKRVFREFWSRHFEYVMPSVSEVLDEFQFLVTPDYIA